MEKVTKSKKTVKMATVLMCITWPFLGGFTPFFFSSVFIASFFSLIVVETITISKSSNKAQIFSNLGRLATF